MITLDQAAAFCDPVRWNGKDSFLACCKAHDDKNPSMSVTESNGKLLVHCHAGCSQDAVLHALGMAGMGGDRPIRTAPIRPTRVSSTANYANEIWQRTKPDDWVIWDEAVSTHPYGIKKELTHAYGAARGIVTGKLVGPDADCLIVPMRTLKGALTGVECINPEGVKQTFGSKGVLLLGNTLDKSLPIYVCEGWADGIALWGYYGNVVVVVAFGKGRIEPFARALDKARPDREIIMVRDAA